MFSFEEVLASTYQAFQVLDHQPPNPCSESMQFALTKL